MGQLGDRMEQDLILRRLSPSTRRNYLLYCRKFAEHYWRPPEEVGVSELLSRSSATSSATGPMAFRALTAWNWSSPVIRSAQALAASTVRTLPKALYHSRKASLTLASRRTINDQRPTGNARQKRQEMGTIAAIAAAKAYR